MKTLLLLIIILFSDYGFTQQEKFARDSQLFKDAKMYNEQRNFEKALSITKTLEHIYPTDYEIYVQQSIAYFGLAKYRESIIVINNAIALEPTDYYNYLLAIRSGLYGEDFNTVSFSLEMLSLLCNEASCHAYATNFINSYISAFKEYNYGVYEQCLTKMSSFETMYNGSKIKKEEILSYASKIVNFDNFKTDEEFKAGLEFLKSLKAKKDGGQLNGLLYNFYLENSIVYFKNSRYKKDVEQLNNLILSESHINSLQAFAIYKKLTESSDNPDYIKEISKIIESKAKLYNNGMKSIILVNILEADYNLGNKKEARELAETLTKFISVIHNDYVKIDLYVWISATYQHFNDEEGLRIVNEGLEFVKENGYSNSKYEANLKIIKGILLNNLGLENIEQKYAENNPATYFNIALNHLKNQEFEKMSAPLEKAKKIIEDNYKNQSIEEKKNNLVYYNKVCSNLLGSYIMQKNNVKIIDVLEGYKSFYLSSLVKSNTQTSSLKDIQKVLKEDEVLIYIMKGVAVNDGLYFSVIVDKKNVHSKVLLPSEILSYLPVNYKDQYIELEIENAKLDYRKAVYNPNPVLSSQNKELTLDGEDRRIVEMYRQNLHPDKIKYPHFANEPKLFGNVFYQAFFQPLEEFISGKSKIIFSLDQELNLLPFESLVTDDDRYLIEKFDISYIQNGSMLVDLRSQPKVTYPKNIIAFGDAKYEKMASNGKQFTSLGDLSGFKFEVADRIDRNLPLNDAFATFSKDAMSYLKGSKLEVEYIAKNIAKSDVRMDNLMTENEFKRMEKSGELNQYRVIHLSSHASVHRYIFDLSGIAFSVPANPIDGEDGILVVKELEKMNFKTDFVMLSACQTGLGQIVPGEGIVGLNSALFAAGAKNTLTSLWSVSDYATTIFTMNLYHKIFNEGKSYQNATNEVKREFIKGAYNEGFDMSHPNYWAAFVYYGE